MNCYILLTERKISQDTMENNIEINHKVFCLPNSSWILLRTSLPVFFNGVIPDISINHILMLMNSWLS